jgi:hypothetical protein
MGGLVTMDNETKVYRQGVAAGPIEDPNRFSFSNAVSGPVIHRVVL